MGGTRQPEEVVPLLKRLEVQVLLRAGHTDAEIEALTGVPERTIRRIGRESPISHVDSVAEVKKRGIGRPSKAEPFRGFVSLRWSEHRNQSIDGHPVIPRARYLPTGSSAGAVASRRRLVPSRDRSWCSRCENGAGRRARAPVIAQRQGRTSHVVQFVSAPRSLEQHLFGALDR